MPFGRTASGKSQRRDDVLGLLVDIGVEDTEGPAVAAEEIGKSDPRRIVLRRDQYRSARAHFDQADAAQDERPSDLFAQIGLGDQQRPQFRRRKRNHLAGLGHGAVDQSGAAGKARRLADDRAGQVFGHRFACTRHAVTCDGDMPADQDKQAETGFPGSKQGLPDCEPAMRAEPLDPGDLLRGQCRKHLVVTIAAHGLSPSVARL